MGFFKFRIPGRVDENPYSSLNLGDRKTRRECEEDVRQVSDTLGNFMNKMNNIIDSEENIKDAMDIPKRIGESLYCSMSPEEAEEKLSIGDHVKCNRSFYSHHAIYVGNGCVIEYNDEEVRRSTLEDFADGDDIILCNTEKALYSPAEIVRRAESRLGECDYNLILNNCDNFATWCRCGGPM